MGFDMFDDDDLADITNDVPPSYRGALHVAPGASSRMDDLMGDLMDDAPVYRGALPEAVTTPLHDVTRGAGSSSMMDKFGGPVYRSALPASRLGKAPRVEPDMDDDAAVDDLSVPLVLDVGKHTLKAGFGGDD